jgi:hypothetical protein
VNPNNTSVNSSLAKTKDTVPCDGALFLYLKDCANKTNREYFWFILKFVVLFRGSLNNFRNDLVVSEMVTEDRFEYTQFYNAETAPEICNEFISDFMEPNDFFGLDTNELIEIIQHLCFWLYFSGYTTSRLSLMTP